MIKELGELTLGNGAISGLIAFAADIASMHGTLISVFKWAGLFLFTWGLFTVVKMGRSGQPASGMDIGLKLIFGAMLYQLTTLIGHTQSSLALGEHSPAASMGYVAKSQEAFGANPVLAGVLAVIALLVFAGYVFAGVAVYGFATLKNQQDAHGAAWKYLWMFIGAVCLTAFYDVGAHIAGSMGGSLSPSLSVEGFK